MRLLILCPYPRGTAASQRFRYEQYLPALAARGIAYDYHAFLDEATHARLYQRGQWAGKAWGVLRGFGRRLLLLARLRRYQVVLVHREASPLGPPVFEWLVARVWRKPLVYDFDDAIWLPGASDANGWAARFKWPGKVAQICQWAHRVSAGNAYLADYARPLNPRVVVNPTTVDTTGYHRTIKVHSHNAVPVIGWTGTHSTLPYLRALVPALTQLATTHAFELRVVADRPPDFALPNARFVPWREATEIADLLAFDIGVMPLADDAWARGKCGFKALQYMGLGIPPVVSPVGVNQSIVVPGESGFWCQTDAEWMRTLAALLTDPARRAAVGANARQRVVDHYSVAANEANFLALFTL